MEKITYSQSRLGTFDNCRLQYKYEYIEKPKLEVEIETIEAFRGGVVHKVLEELYKLVKVGTVNVELGSVSQGSRIRNWEK